MDGALLQLQRERTRLKNETVHKAMEEAGERIRKKMQAKEEREQEAKDKIQWVVLEDEWEMIE